MESTEPTKMSSIPFRQAKSPRRRARGAAFVEALVVISVFILFLMGTIFFRELYVKKLTTMRVARAGAMAHAMAACKPDIRAVLRDDLSESFTVKQRASADVVPTERARAQHSLADKILGGTGDRGTLLNEVNEVSLSSSASATSKPTLFGPELGFRGDVASSSYVSCSDELGFDQYESIVPFITSKFRSYL